MKDAKCNLKDPLSIELGRIVCLHQIAYSEDIKQLWAAPIGQPQTILLEVFNFLLSAITTTLREVDLSIVHILWYNQMSLH